MSPSARRSRPGMRRRPTACGACERRRTPCDGGSTFPERPDRSALDARIVWHADLDPFVLAVRAEPLAEPDSYAFALSRLAGLATLVIGPEGEHLALSDGLRRIRLDIVEGSLADAGPVRLHFLVAGVAGVEAQLITIQRLLALGRQGGLVAKLFPVEAGWRRRIEALRVADARAAGASYRDIAAVLYGERVVRSSGASDYLVSRVRRRVAEAADMQRGGWRDLLRGAAPGIS